MRINRFYIKNEIPGEGIFILENEAVSHQLSRVLKIKRGEKVIFFNGSGYDFLMRIDKFSSRFVSGRILEKIKNEKDPDIEMHLYQSLIKKDKFEWVLEKCTELGIKFFHPVISERSVKTGVNFERARRIVQEATEQSGQDKIPEIKEIVKFNEAVEKVGGANLTILLDAGEKRQHRVFSRTPDVDGIVNIFVGPEGGFSEKELNWAEEHDIIIASLGPRILRSETAAIVSTAHYLTLNNG